MVPACQARLWSELFRYSIIFWFPGLSSFLVAFCQVLGTMGLILVVERAGRKPFLIASNFVMGVSLLALSAFFGLDQVFDLQHLAAVPIVVLMVYIFFFSIGKSRRRRRRRMTSPLSAARTLAKH